MRILITGGAGFLGTHLVNFCLHQPGSEITVLDSLEFNSGALPQNLKKFWDRITYVRGSVCNSKLLKELIPYQDIIFHCAAQTSHVISIQDPKADAEVNAEGTLKILEAMRFFNRQAVLVYPSTTSVIGKTEQNLADESHPLRPLDIYSIHKVLSERYCLSYAKFHNLRTVILRFGNLYGPYGRNEPEYGFINYFIHQVLQNRPLPIFGPGTQIRNVMYAEDAAALMFQAAHCSSIHGAFWFATSSHHHSVIEIAEAIISEFQGGTILHREWPADREGIEIGSVQFSNQALRSKIAWPQDTDLKTGIRKTFQALLASRNIPA